MATMDAAFRARPHTPRRLGTTHEPQAADVAHCAPRGACDADTLVGEAAALQKLHPAYWANSGKHFQLRPNSAPSKRPLVPSATLAPHVPDAAVASPCVTPRVVGVLAFAKLTPRSSGRRPTSAARDAVIDSGRAYEAAAPLVSPRTRGFDLSAAPLRFPTAPAAPPPASQVTPVPSPPPRSSGGNTEHAAHVPTPRFQAMTSRAQANYARGAGPCPTVCYYQSVLQNEAGIAAAHHLQSNNDVEAHLQVFVDEQDHRYTVGMRGATVRRARVVVRQRGYAPESLERGATNAMGGESPRGFDMAHCIGRDAMDTKRKVTGRQGTPGATTTRSSTATVVDAMDSSTPRPIPTPPTKHTAAVAMAKTTGREAPVSTVLVVPASSAAQCVGSPRSAESTTARHVPRIDFSKMRPRSASARGATDGQPDRSYRVSHALVSRKAPSAVMV